MRVLLCVLLLASVLPAQIGFASIDSLGGGCGWLANEFGGQKFEIIPLPNDARGRVAVSMYQPYSRRQSDMERWIVVGPEVAKPTFHGTCPIFLNPARSTFWMYPDINTWAYFTLPPNEPALHGVSFVVQGFVRRQEPPRIDVSAAWRVTWGPGR